MRAARGASYCRCERIVTLVSQAERRVMGRKLFRLRLLVVAVAIAAIGAPAGHAASRIGEPVSALTPLECAVLPDVQRMQISACSPGTPGVGVSTAGTTFTQAQPGRPLASEPTAHRAESRTQCPECVGLPDPKKPEPPASLSSPGTTGCSTAGARPVTTKARLASERTAHGAESRTQCPECVGLPKRDLDRPEDPKLHLRSDARTK
jgi:hypothetical protein